MKEWPSPLLVAFGSLCIGAVVLMQGCSCPDFARGVNAYTTEILPAYKFYVEHDEALDADSKRIRLRSADRFQELVNQAQKTNPR